MVRTVMVFLFGLVTGVAAIHILEGPLDFPLLRREAGVVLDEAGRQARDLRLATAVRTALALQKDFDLFGGIKVEAKVDHITLSGTVASKRQQQLAVLITRGVDGVESVDNQLVIHNAREGSR